MIEIRESKAMNKTVNVFKIYQNGVWLEVFTKREEAEKFVSELMNKTTTKKTSTKKIASFSNGFTREYKGDRKVKAAWAIINKETQEIILSGFSMSCDLAFNSARQRRSDCRSLFAKNDPLHWPVETRGRYRRQEEKRRKDHNKRRLQIIDSKIKIEIIDL